MRTDLKLTQNEPAKYHTWSCVLWFQNPEIHKTVSPPSSDAGYDSDTEAYEAIDLDELKLGLPEDTTGDESQGQGLFTQSSARTEDDVSSDIFDEDYEYLDDVTECEEKDIFDQVIRHVIDDSPEMDNDVALVNDFPIDEGTEDKAVIYPNINDSARTENGIPRDILHIDYGNVTENVATYTSFRADVSKNTDKDDDICDEDVNSNCNDYFSEHEIIEYYESARTDNDVDSDVFDDSEGVFISIKSDCWYLLLC